MTGHPASPRGFALQELFRLPSDGPVEDSLVKRAFTALLDRHKAGRRHYLGFPVAYDVAFPHTFELLTGRLFNNISTVDLWPPGYQHAMEAETAVLDWCAELFGIDGPRWGHITTGGTAGNRAGIRTGRRCYPDAVLIHSAAAHYSVATAGTDFAMSTVEVGAHPTGAMDLAALDTALAKLRADSEDPAVIVVATYGTTFTEASDDLAGICAVLDQHRITRRYLHLDGALAGIPLALDGCGRFDLADSISVSGYKFLAVPDACGIVVGRGAQASSPVSYTQTLNETGTGVRSGLHAALLFEAIAQLGAGGHRQRAHTSRGLAEYTIKKLAGIGVSAWRQPDAYFTVVLRTPPGSVLERWVLSNDGAGLSHIVCVPGMVEAQIDEFTADLRAAVRAAGRPLAPQQRPRRNLFAGLIAGADR